MTFLTGASARWTARIAAMAATVAGASYLAGAGWSAEGTPRFLLYLLITIAASRMRVNLPGSLGAMSVNFVFTLIAIVELDAGRAAIVAFTGALAECCWEIPRSRASRLAFESVNRGVADALRNSCREYDFVARMDGNKFVMLFPDSGAADLAFRTQEFREIGRKIGADLPMIEGLTMTLGQAHFPADGSDAERLLAAADRRMYGEKRGAGKRATAVADTFMQPARPRLRATPHTGIPSCISTGGDLL